MIITVYNVVNYRMWGLWDGGTTRGGPSPIHPERGNSGFPAPATARGELGLVVGLDVVGLDAVQEVDGRLRELHGRLLEQGRIPNRVIGQRIRLEEHLRDEGGGHLQLVRALRPERR